MTTRLTRRTCLRCRQSQAVACFRSLGSASGGRARVCFTCERQTRALRHVLQELHIVPVTLEPRCCSCDRAGIFVAGDGSRICARCLKERVKERRGDA